MRRSGLVTSFVSVLFAVTVVPCAAQVGPPQDDRLAALEERLRAATRELEALTREVEAIKTQREPAVSPVSVTRTAAASLAAAPDADDGALAKAPGIDGVTGTFADQILGGLRNRLEASRPFPAKPDILLQARFSTFPLSDATLNDYSPNFRVSRLATRWAGMVADRWGAGIEIQYRAAPDAVPEQLLNDAYLDFTANKAFTIRAGQFVKPFGFEVQQPDAERESPERAMFAGYVFPGQRDRGVMVMGDLSATCTLCTGLGYAAAIVNGNRFFRDTNDQANYVFRVRKVWDPAGFAIGTSVQLGTQIIPPGVNQTNDENAFGVDAQWTKGRLGLRGEFTHANRPSTFLAPDPEFTPAFVAGPRVRSVGSTATAVWSLDKDRQIYARFDRLAGDTVTLCPGQKDGSCKINAVNGGFRQQIASHGFIGIDLQWKDRLSFNDDAVNTHVQITSTLLF